MNSFNEAELYRQRIGDYIRTLRKTSKMTQAQLAEKLDIATITLQRYESGERLPSFEFLERLSKYYNTTISKIIPSFDDMKDLAESLGLSIYELQGVPALDVKLADERLAALKKSFFKLNATGQNIVIELAKTLAEIDDLKRK